MAVGGSIRWCKWLEVQESGEETVSKGLAFSSADLMRLDDRRAQKEQIGLD